MIKVAVIGVGNFGREHARVYHELADAELVAVCDPDEASGREVATQYGVEWVKDYQDLIGRVEAVSLVVPTFSHHPIACSLLEAQIAVLVEKPIARTVGEADEMIETATRTGTVLQVGHLERFNPAVVAAKQIVTRPLFFEAHRLSLFTPRSLDIDVVLDLMIHDLDVVLSFVRSEVAEIRAAGVPILTPKIDIANARLEFTDGCVVNLTASRVSGEKVRKVRFFQPHEYVSIDYAAQEAAIISVKPSATGRLEFNSRPLDFQRGESLRLEIESFLRAVRGEPVQTTGEQGRRALAVAVNIIDKIREHAERAGVPFFG